MKLINSTRTTGMLSMIAAVATAFAVSGCAMDTSTDEDVSADNDDAEETTTSVAMPLGRWYFASRRDFRDFGWDIDDFDRLGWDWAGRAAFDVCARRGHIGGFFDGYRVGERFGLMCLDRGIDVYDVPRGDIVGLGWNFPALNRMNWGFARRVAFDVCSRRGYGSGFFPGYDFGDMTNLACLNRGWDWNRRAGLGWFEISPWDSGWDPGWGFDNPYRAGWSRASLVARNLCGRHGFGSGLFDGRWMANRFGYMCF